MATFTTAIRSDIDIDLTTPDERGSIVKSMPNASSRRGPEFTRSSTTSSTAHSMSTSRIKHDPACAKRRLVGSDFR